MYKLLALDLDGTVIKPDRTISPLLIKYVHTLSKKTPVLIVTGRHHTAARPYYAELGLTAPAICCNGTYVYDFEKDQVISQNSLDKDIAAQFFDLAEEHKLNAVLYTKTSMLYNPNQPIDYIADFQEWVETFDGDMRPDLRPIGDFKQAIKDTEYVWKFVIEGDNIQAFAALPFVQEHFNGEQSWSNRIDFAPKGNSKGNALSAYIASQGIDAADVVAFGDHHNDISMLKMVGMGVAMNNADDTIKAIADRITSGTNNDDDAITQVLAELFAD